MPDQQQKSRILPYEATISPCGCVKLPLSSGEWDLVLEPTGMLALLCNVPIMQDGTIEQHAVLLGEVELDPIELLEAVNRARSRGASPIGPS